MTQDADRLVWIDLEMTGLKPDTDRILEVAIVVTDADLAPIAVAPVWVLHQDDSTLAAMDSWNQGTHGRSGLIEKVKASTSNEIEVEAAALAFLHEHVPPRIVADVRQLDLPGPALPRALDARARGVLPLPESRRVDAEGAVPALEARSDERHPEGRQARGAGRRLRVDRGAYATTGSISSKG